MPTAVHGVFNRYFDLLCALAPSREHIPRYSVMMNPAKAHARQVVWSLMKYKTEAEIIEMIDKFETGSIARDDWHHFDHLIVAFHYLRSMTFDDAVERMRSGIHSLLVSFGVDPAADGSPYHETLTVFWMKAVAGFISENGSNSLFEACSALEHTFPKDFPLSFYSRERLFSEGARIRFVEPDLAPCP